LLAKRSETMRLLALLFVVCITPAYALDPMAEFGPDIKRLWASGVPKDADKMMNAVLAYTMLVKATCKWGAGVNFGNLDSHARELACYYEYKRKNPFYITARKYLTQ
jgi:hypothetical protein